MMAPMARRYGASPAHLLAVLAGGAVSAYAVTRVGYGSTLGWIALWFGFMIVAHDLLLFPLYAAVDNLGARVRADSGRRPTIPWVNYLRVPTVLSALLLLAWFPLVFRLSPGYETLSGRSLDPFLWRWLAVSGVLYAAAGTLYLCRRLLAGRDRTSSASLQQPPDERGHT